MEESTLMSYWRLQSPPFENVPDLRFFYLFPHHEEALSRLSYAVQSRREVTVLTGEVGCGKSLICQALLHNLLQEEHHVGLVLNPKYPPLEFLQTLPFCLGVNGDTREKKFRLLGALQKELRSEAEKGKHTVLIIDEAHVMDAETLEEVRLLLNYQLPDRIILTLIFVGQPGLKELVEQNKSLDQRVFFKYHLPPLSAAETTCYIAFRLEKAGLTRNVFTDEAMTRIYEASGGIPRRINTISNLCLLVGQGAGITQIDADIVNAGIQQQKQGTARSSFSLAQIPKRAVGEEEAQEPQPPSRPQEEETTDGKREEESSRAQTFRQEEDPLPSQRAEEPQKILTPDARRIFSGIYDNLLASAGAAQPRIVLVCSASNGEGASTVAAGLAIAAAEKRAGQVLLIDGNFHSPRVCETFGMAEGPGLGDLLVGSAEADAVVKRTTIPGLSVVGVGVIQGDRIQALEAPKFRGLLEKLVVTYPFIVVDGPAINAHAESGLYAPQVDRVLLVVCAGVSRAPVVTNALAKLSAAGCNKAEVVLNRRTFDIPQWVYKRL